MMLDSHHKPIQSQLARLSACNMAMASYQCAAGAERGAEAEGWEAGGEGGGGTVNADLILPSPAYTSATGKTLRWHVAASSRHAK